MTFMVPGMRDTLMRGTGHVQTFFILGGLLWLAGTLLGPAGTCSAQTRRLEKVLVGELPILPAIGSFIAKEEGYFEELGLDVEFRMFKISTKVVPLLASDMLDVGGSGISAGVYNALAGGGARIVADRGHHPYEDSDEPVHAVVISRKLHPVELNAETLRGKRFAVSGRGSPQEIYLELFLGQYGLAMDDVEVLTMPYPNMLPGLANGSIFGAALLEPFLTISEQKGFGVPALAGRELYPGQQGGVLIFSDRFIRTRRETAVKFMIGYLRGVRSYKAYLEGDAGEGKIFDIVRKNTSLDDRELFRKIGKPALNADGRLNLEGMERDIRWLHEHGYVDVIPEMSRVVDLTFLQEANQALAK